MSRGRGDIVETDPFRDESEGRPFLLVNCSAMPFHGEQFKALSLTTRAWHDARFPLADGGG